MEVLLGLLFFAFGGILGYGIYEEVMLQRKKERKLDYIYKEIRKLKKR